MLKDNKFVHIDDENKEFTNSAEFYRFVEHDNKEGNTAPVESWHSLLEDGQINNQAVPFKQMDEKFGERSDIFAKNQNTHISDMFFDAANCDLFDAVRPIKWVDPEVDGADKYDILVIGGGAGGLVTAAGSKGLGAKVCLIERGFLGGDCLNNGCVPSKAFLKSCNVAHNARTAAKYGVLIEGEIKINFPAIMTRMKEIRAEISENDSAQRFSTNMGVDLYLGHAKFTGKNTVEINGKEISFLKACIATGGRPRVPEIEGINDVQHYTSDSIWNLTALPKDLLVVGTGPIGCELGQGFARLGSKVTMVSSGNQFLRAEDADCSVYLQEQMKADGVEFLMQTKPQKVSKNDDGSVSVTYQTEGAEPVTKSFSTILFAIGRVPNVESLGCEAAGVAYEADGVTTNDFLQTSNPDIYAVGDCLPGPKFTHNSDVHARMVVRNALFEDQKAKSSIVLPKCTYTDPEVASVGVNEKEMKAQNIEFDAYVKFFDRCDRATCESKKGIYKVWCRKGTDEIVGATLVGGPAGDLICQITQAITLKIGMQDLGKCIYPYPSFAESFGHMSNYQYMPKYKLGPAGKNAIREGMKEY